MAGVSYRAEGSSFDILRYESTAILSIFEYLRKFIHIRVELREKFSFASCVSSAKKFRSKIQFRSQILSVSTVGFINHTRREMIIFITFY